MSVVATGQLTPSQSRLVTSIVVPVTLLVLAAFIAARFAATPAMADWLDNLHWTAAYVAAAVLAWLGVRWADDSVRSARRWFAYGLSASAIGQLTWDLQTAFAVTGFPAPSDWLFVCFGPCCVAGLWRTIRQHQPRPAGWAVMLDVTTLAVVVLMTVLALYLPRHTGSASVGFIFMVIYPISMLTSSCLALVMVPTLRLVLHRHWVIFVVASLAYGVLWLQWLYLSQDNSVVTNPWLYLAFSLVALALGVGAMQWRVHSSTDARRIRRSELVLRILPLLVVGNAAVTAALAWSWPGIPHVATLVIYISSALVLVLAAVRQSLLLIERDRLLAIEKRHNELEYTFKTMYQMTSSGVTLLDPDGRFREINPGFVKLFGYSHEQAQHLTIHTVNAGPPYPLNGPLGLVDAQGTGVLEATCRRQDGTLVEVEMSSAVIPGSGGQVYVIMRNIAERKHANEQLKAMAQRLDIATRVAGIGIWEYHPASKSLVWDAQMHELYGTPAGIAPTNQGEWSNRIHPDDRHKLQALYRNALAEGRGYHDEFRILLPDGNLRYIETWGNVQVDPAGRPERWIGVNLDVTARKQAEALRLRLEEQLRQSQKLEAIGTLASGIAHDFNNVLGAILGNTELALQDLRSDHPALTSMQEIRKAGQRGKELVRRIVAFGKPSELSFQPTHLAAVIEDSLKLVRATLPTTVDIHCQLHADLPLVSIDSSQIAQVLLNLCTNAYHAMEQHKGRIDITLDLHDFSATAAPPSSDLKPGRYVCLHIGDTGSGIDPAIVDRIFEPFFTTKAAGEGSGLGLSMVHNIVRSHGGAILLDTQRGIGSTFHIYLPVVPNPESTETTPAAATISAPTRGSGQHVLYVDDEEALVFLTKRMLERFGYRVTGYTEAKDALQAALADDADFDLVITDQSMPVMSGIDLARELLDKRPASRIVLVSGYLPPGDVELARSVGIQAVILKPDTIDELAAAVHRLLSVEAPID